MVAIGRITDAKKVDPPYSPGGAKMHPPEPQPKTKTILLHFVYFVFLPSVL